MKIGDMKVGDRLVFGMYSTGRGEADTPIIWLKASKDNQFISEYVLDSVQFDEREPGMWHGNPDYTLSNVYQFLNSAEDYICYAPTHPKDIIGQSYARKNGFLRLFDPYELASLDGCVDLPSVADIRGSEDREKLDLFKKKGARGKCENASSYSDYFTCDSFDGAVLTIPSSGKRTALLFPNWPSGIRPKCKLKADIEVTRREDETFHVVPFDCETDQDEGYDDTAFRALLGI